jgi:hypothetical protein
VHALPAAGDTADRLLARVTAQLAAALLEAMLQVAGSGTKYHRSPAARAHALHISVVCG